MGGLIEKGFHRCHPDICRHLSANSQKDNGTTYSCQRPSGAPIISKLSWLWPFTSPLTIETVSLWPLIQSHCDHWYSLTVTIDTSLTVTIETASLWPLRQHHCDHWYSLTVTIDTASLWPLRQQHCYGWDSVTVTIRFQNQQTSDVTFAHVITPLN